ncbi:hypothetical protein ABZX93_30115 [Streptomyces sp. NPDC006632]|uniref:hypothetical protein n=1 Tax=Streptomyces sp. NPDC006632 TaxID=3157182 RepID=UPI0033B38DBC
MTMTVEPIREAYSFVCLHCGHAWEGSYAIHHSTDANGVPRADYYVRGVRVPSPLTGNMCRVCHRTTIRVLRSGRVAAARPPVD